MDPGSSSKPTKNPRRRRREAPPPRPGPWLPRIEPSVPNTDHNPQELKSWAKRTGFNPNLSGETTATVPDPGDEPEVKPERKGLDLERGLGRRNRSPPKLEIEPMLGRRNNGFRMGSSSKRSRDMDDDEKIMTEEFEGDPGSDMENSDGDSENHSKAESDHQGDDDEEEEEEGGDEQRNAEMEELERQYQHLRHQEQDYVKNLKRHKDEDTLKGQAVKNQKALWDKILELRFLLQKSFSSSNKLPQEPIRSSFCTSGMEVDEAYMDLISSSKQTLKCMLELQEALLEGNPSIDQGNKKEAGKDEGTMIGSAEDGDEEWLQMHKMHCRIAPFRNNSIDKWQRRSQVTTGAAAFKGKLQAFNQNISEQVAGYMRDPSRMTSRMQLRKSSVGLFGKVPPEPNSTKEEDADLDGDPELIDDSEFYQQLLKEFLESMDPTSAERTYYALRKLQTKKRKMVDRRASKSRKIRYNVHEKIVNFMAPVPMALPSMAPKLFENLFGVGNQNSAPAP